MLLDSAAAFQSVIAHAGEHNGEQFVPVDRRKRLQGHIDGRFVQHGRLPAHLQSDLSVRQLPRRGLESERSDVNRAGEQQIAMLRFLHAHLTDEIKAFGQRLREAGRIVCNADGPPVEQPITSRL